MFYEYKSILYVYFSVPSWPHKSQALWKTEEANLSNNWRFLIFHWSQSFSSVSYSSVLVITILVIRFYLRVGSSIFGCYIPKNFFHCQRDIRCCLVVILMFKFKFILRRTVDVISSLHSEMIFNSKEIFIVFYCTVFLPGRCWIYTITKQKKSPNFRIVYLGELLGKWTVPIIFQERQGNVHWISWKKFSLLEHNVWL